MHASLAISLTACLAVKNVLALPRADFYPSSVDNAPSLEARQNEGVDTMVEIGDEDIIAQDRNASPGESPQAFSELFDHLESDLCGPVGCSLEESYCVDATAGQEVCIKANGHYNSAMRGPLMRAVRGAFDRTVRRQDLSTGVMEVGTNVVHVVSESGENSGWSLRVELTNQGSGGGKCGPAIDIIAAGGALLPEFGRVFGMVGFACGSVSNAARFQAEATG